MVEKVLKGNKVGTKSEKLDSWNRGNSWDQNGLDCIWSASWFKTMYQGVTLCMVGTGLEICSVKQSKYLCMFIQTLKGRRY